MKTGFKYFGIFSAIALYLVLLVLAIFFSVSLLDNSGSFVINTIVFAGVCLLFHLFVMPYFKIKPGLITVAYLCSTIVVLNTSCSALWDLLRVERIPGRGDKMDVSPLLIVPMVFIIGIVWGWVFDWRKNRIIKSRTISE